MLRKRKSSRRKKRQSERHSLFARLFPEQRRFLRFEILEDRRMLATGTISNYWNGTPVNIPDNGGSSNTASVSLNVSGAPSGATITDVDIYYEVKHTYRGNLRVWATTYEGGWDDWLMWDRPFNGAGNDSGNDIFEWEYGIDDWDGIGANRTWYLVAGDYAGGEVGYLDFFEVHVHWYKPDPLPSITAGRLTWHSYTAYDDDGTGYRPLDGAIHIYDFDSSKHYSMAEDTIANSVVHAINPSFSDNGRYLTFMGLSSSRTYSHFDDSWANWLDIFVYDFSSDSLRNISEEVGLDTFGKVEEDPVFHPNGSALAFKRDRDDIWTVGLLDGSFTQVTAGAGEESGPQYSPDGNWIIFWVGDGPEAYIAKVSDDSVATSTYSTVIDNNPVSFPGDTGIQDYFPSYWDDSRIIYTSWDTPKRVGFNDDDDIRIFDQSGAIWIDYFAAFDASFPVDDSDAFPITSELIGYSRRDPWWELWYGDPVNGTAVSLGISLSDKHNLGGEYTTTQVVYVAPSADFDEDGDVDGRDFLAWQRGIGTSNATKSDGDADNDLDVDGDDLATWQSQYGLPPLGAGVAATTALESSLEPLSCGGSTSPLSSELVDAAMAFDMADNSFTTATPRLGRAIDWQATAETFENNNLELTWQQRDNSIYRGTGELTFDDRTDGDEPGQPESEDLIDSLFADSSFALFG